MKGILEALFSSLIGGLVDWFKSEKAEADAWAAKSKEQQLDSIKTGQAKETEYRKVLGAATQRELSIKAWNAGVKGQE